MVPGQDSNLESVALLPRFSLVGLCEHRQFAAHLLFLNEGGVSAALP